MLALRVHYSRCVPPISSILNYIYLKKRTESLELKKSKGLKSHNKLPPSARQGETHSVFHSLEKVECTNFVFDRENKKCALFLLSKL